MKKIRRKIIFSLIIIALFLLCFKQCSEKMGLKIDFSKPMWGDYDSSAPISASSKGSPNKAYYATLTNRQKYAYNAILNDIYSFPEEIEIPEIESQDITEIFKALLLDNPDLYFLNRKCEIIKRQLRTYFVPKYNCTKAVYENMLSQTNEAIASFSQSLPQQKDDYETEKKIHDYLVDNCAYSMGDDSFEYSTAYGCLINHKASCEGYSKAFKLIADSLGIECAMISGTVISSGEETAHMWNLVKINSAYYHLDCTWDDPVAEENDSHGHYAYFNVTDDMIGKTHTDFSISIPCTCKEQNYHIKNGLYFDYYSQNDEDKLIDIISAKILEGDKIISLRFDTSMAYEAAFSQLITNNRFSSLLNSAENKTGIEFATKYTYYHNSKMQILEFILE